MPDTQQQLRDDADALDREAAAADWIAGLATDDNEAARVRAEAEVMRAWAGLNRTVADNLDAGDEPTP